MPPTRKSSLTRGLGSWCGRSMTIGSVVTSSLRLGRALRNFLISRLASGSPLAREANDGLTGAEPLVFASPLRLVLRLAFRDQGLFDMLDVVLSESCARVQQARLLEAVVDDVGMVQFHVSHLLPSSHEAVAVVGLRCLVGTVRTLGHQTSSFATSGLVPHLGWRRRALAPLLTTDLSWSCVISIRTERPSTGLVPSITVPWRWKRPSTGSSGNDAPNPPSGWMMRSLDIR